MGSNGRQGARTHAKTVERCEVNGVNAWSLAGGGTEVGIPVVRRQKARTSPGSGTPLRRADWKGTLRAPMQDVGMACEPMTPCALDAHTDRGHATEHVKVLAEGGREREKRGMGIYDVGAKDTTVGGDAGMHTQRMFDVLPEGTPSGVGKGGWDDKGGPNVQCYSADLAIAMCSGNRGGARAPGAGGDGATDEKADDHSHREGGNSDHDWRRDAGGQSEKDGGEHMRLRSSGDETAPRAERD